MRYLYFLLRYGSVLLFGAWAEATCAFDESSRSARCFSFADISFLHAKNFSRAAEIKNLEVECLSDQNTTFSIPFPNLNALSIHGCGENTAEIQMPLHTIRSLNLSKNGITSLKWQKFQSSSSDIVDLRQNPLSCEDCINLWIWEHQQRSLAKNSIWDLHFIFGLPRQILTDDEFLHCNFSHCPREEVHAYTVNKPLKIGDTVRLYCDVNGLNESFENNENITNFKQFIWPLRNDFDVENSSAKLNETWNSFRSQMILEITSLTSHEVGYVACICQYCQYRPAFDVLELRFDTNITVSLEEDERDSHLIVHGNPIEDLNITITRISDNSTETNLLSNKKTSFFNDSLLLRFQQEHSHFFVRYYSLIVQECILCPPRLSTHIDGDYLIEICRVKIGDCAIAKGYLDHPIYESIKKVENEESSKSNKSRHLLLITIFLILLIIGLLIALSKTHLKHRLLKKGWEIKRRRTSRNTNTTDETSIRLDDYSASSSLNYIAQHVPLIDKEFINVKEKIGKGAFGEVHCAEWIQKDLTTIVAIKMLHGIQLDSDLDKEAALLAKMDHPNIVRLFGICRWDTQIALVMEMMNLGDLKNYVRQRMPRCDNYSQFPAPLLTTELLNIAGQIAAGLCYLNSQQIVHRDLAARNCLVQGETDLKVCNAAFRKPIAVKISDFGMSRRLYSDGEYYKMQNGKTVLPVRWLPPECLSSGKFTIQSDMWSFGMTLFELFSYGDVPFGDLSNNEVLTAVMSGMKPQLPSSFPEPINNLISQCWRNAPEERITASEALNRLQIIQ